jgi:superfamily II helicase
MDITLLATSVNSAITLAKSIATVASDATIKVKSIELLNTIIDLQGGILSLQSEYQSLLQEKYSLEKKFMEVNSWEQEKAKYELVKLGEGVHVFALKRTYESSIPFHYICPNCYHENKKSILVAEYTSSKDSKYVCPKCKNFFVTNTDLNDGMFVVDD